MAVREQSRLLDLVSVLYIFSQLRSSALNKHRENNLINNVLCEDSAVYISIVIIIILFFFCNGGLQCLGLRYVLPGSHHVSYTRHGWFKHKTCSCYDCVLSIKKGSCKLSKHKYICVMLIKTLT